MFVCVHVSVCVLSVQSLSVEKSDGLQQARAILL